MGNSLFCSPGRPGSRRVGDDKEADRAKSRDAVIISSEQHHLPTPKYLLWGCETVTEHYDHIAESCELVKDKHSREGLQLLGYEYRLVHATNGCCDCDIEGGECILDQPQQRYHDHKHQKKSSMETSPSTIITKTTITTSQDSIDEDGDSKISSIDDDDDETEDDSDSEIEHERTQLFNAMKQQRQGQDNDSNDFAFANDSTTMEVPIGMSINEHLRLSQRGGLLGNSNDNYVHLSSASDSLRQTAKELKSSLFSLATHNSRGSIDDNSVALGDSLRSLSGCFENADYANDDAGTASIDQSCTTRLFHIASDTMITESNHKMYIADGKYYDEVTRLCMEYAHDVMKDVGNLEWKKIDEDGQNDDIKALVTKHRNDTHNESRQTATKSVLIVTGKGKVGAGIFSRRLLLTHGIEPASALFLIKSLVRNHKAVSNIQGHTAESGSPRQPGRNNNHIRFVLLDPNCLGPQKALEVFERSCDRLVFDASNDCTSVYVLAHSMAGSQLVRYFLRKSQQEAPATAVDRYLSQIDSVVFTDSNHNINWVSKKLPTVAKFLQGPRCLYVKSHKVHEKQKHLGERHHNCEYWKHRFGSIKTIWAGTREHALTNYTSRFHILDHFDLVGNHLDGVEYGYNND